MYSIDYKLLDKFYEDRQSWFCKASSHTLFNSLNSRADNAVCPSSLPSIIVVFLSSRSDKNI